MAGEKKRKWILCFVQRGLESPNGLSLATIDEKLHWRRPCSKSTYKHFSDIRIPLWKKKKSLHDCICNYYDAFPLNVTVTANNSRMCCLYLALHFSVLFIDLQLVNKCEKIGHCSVKAIRKKRAHLIFSSAAKVQ